MKRYLVVANQTLGGTNLLTAIGERLERDRECTFHLLVPATQTTGLYEGVLAAYAGDLPDHGAAVRAARQRLDQLLEWLRTSGHEADGEIGEVDPMAAIERATGERRFDEIILSTLPPGASRWLSLDLVHRVRRAVDVPVTHVEGPAAPRPGEPLPPPPQPLPRH